jgi:hypothetical protein
VPEERKMIPFEALQACRIPVLNFEVEEAQAWN